jgi:anti-sigma regulatory factor (Ser/Thr protein kinase)
MTMRAIAVVESTHVAEVRREASEVATSLSFDATTTGRVALVATELASNVLKHGAGGEVLIGSYDDTSGSGIELIALDKGRGIADLQASLRDGHSSAGSAGQGLGAIRRQSQLMEVASWPGVGTAVLARLGAQTASPTALPAWFGSICVPLRGEQVCGDAVMCAETQAGRTMIVADGLGHGPEAARAALEAIRLFRQHQSRPLPELLEFIHAGLRSTRGAAVAVSRFALDGSKVTFGGHRSLRPQAHGLVERYRGTRRAAHPYI